MSYAWGPPTYTTQPVTIADGATAIVTITNQVVQHFGNFSMTKVVAGPGGYIGGTDRVFPVSYSCALTGGLTTTGTLNITPAQPVSPATPIPSGSVCTFTETLTNQPGDFADPSYVWSGAGVFAPPTVTIGQEATSTVTLTNTYVREFGSLTIAKVVSGDGYTGGGAPNFTVNYDCGPGFSGVVTIAAGRSATVPGLPARVSCVVQETPPDAGLLEPAFVWGTPTWSPGPIGVVPVNAAVTLTVSNPTTPVFGQVRVTKAVSGETQGITAGASFHLVADCGLGAPFTFDLAAGATGSTGDIPVGSTCTITETPPVGGLVDASFAWGPTPEPQAVTLTSSGQVVAVTMTNTVVRVLGTVTVTKAPIPPAGIVDPARTFSIDYGCTYGNDAPVAGTVSLTSGETATLPSVFLESVCVVEEQGGSLTAPPSATDPSWVWLPTTYDPSPQVVVSSATTPVAIVVTNSIQQLTGSYNVTKVVVGAGKDGGFVPGTTFGMTVACTSGSTATFALGDGDSFPGAAEPASTTCTVTEVGVPPPASPAYGWDPVQFTVNGQPAGTGNSVSFQIPAGGAPVQVNVINPITPRTGSIVVQKQITGEVAGLSPDAPPFAVQLNCGPGQLYAVAVPANGGATQDGIPVGSQCTATESGPSGGLVDASYAWGSPSFVPADPVSVALDAPQTITVTNPILRVTAPVQLVKQFSGAQGVVDPDFNYAISWSCTYDGAVVASGDELVPAGAGGIVVADAVPVTSLCTATENVAGLPTFADPAFRWETPVITDTTVAAPGPNTITVANSLVRDNGRVIVRKVVTGATDGYIGTGDDFTLHGQCRVPDHPEIPVRTRDGSIANGGEVTIEPVSVGWTCFGTEDTPSQDLLKDASYAWGPAVLTPPGDFVLTRGAPGQVPEQVFVAENPIVRVTSTFTIVKNLVDPNGIVSPTATFRGTYSCQYGTDPPSPGHGRSRPPRTARSRCRCRCSSVRSARSPRIRHQARSCPTAPGRGRPPPSTRPPPSLPVARRRCRSRTPSSDSSAGCRSPKR